MKVKNLNFIYSISFITFLLLLTSCGNGVIPNGKNIPPTAYAGEDRIVKLNENIEFSGHGTDQDGFITLYQWDLNGDGIFDKEFDYATTFTYSYKKAGIYKVTLRVTDDKGATAEDSFIIKAGYPYPKEGEENWNFNSEPLLDISSDVVSSTVFKYNKKYYMLISTNPPFFHYAISTDGISWDEIDASEFPCHIPIQASSSNDIELHYVDNEFVIVYSLGGAIYLGKSSNGSTWSGLNNYIIQGGYSNPTYIRTTNFERLWFVKDNDIYFSQKKYSDTSWPNPNNSIPNFKNNFGEISYCHLLFDGETYYMWYTDKSWDKIYLLYSIDPLFQSDYTNSTVLDINNLPNLNTIYSTSIIFNYYKYQYILYIVANSSPDSKIYTSYCSSFDSN